MKLTWRWVAGLGAVAIVILWVLTPFVIRIFYRIVGDDTTMLGATGDIFGVMSALFNGLAFLGIIVVLVYEMGERKKDLAEVERLARERHRKMRPFVVPGLESSGLRLGRAEFDGDEFVCEMSSELSVVNASPDVAMNAIVTTVLSVNGARTWRSNLVTTVLDLPIIGEEPSDVRSTFSARGEAANGLLRALAARGSVVIAVEATYEALNSAGWASKVRYALELDADGPDRISQILSKNEDFYIRGGAAGRPVTFTCSVEAGSWVQEER